MPIFVDDERRPRSIRTEKEELDVLEKDVAALPENERRALFEVMESLRDGSEESLESYDRVVKVEYNTKPVDVATFLTDPYFMGETGRSLWPQLKQDMIDLFEGGYHEAVLTGSLGYGKSFFSTIAMAYVLYQMSCLKSPQRAYGIDPGSHIYIAMLSVTEKTARRVVINELIGKLTYCRYFQEHFPWKAAPSNLEIRFPNQVMVTAGSTGSSAIIGLNAFSGFIDESSFMGVGKEVDRSGREIVVDRGEAIYKSIIRRMKSRFQRVGRLPGLLIVASSKERPTAFIERRVRDAMDEKDPDFYVRDYPVWGPKPKEFISHKTFKVVAGTDTSPSRILGEDPDPELVEFYETKDMLVLDVPMDYWDDFHRDLEGSLRDLAGVATLTVSPFIHRIDTLYASVDPELPWPIEGGEWIAGTPLDIQWGLITDAFQRKLPGGYTEQAWRPKRHPEAVRYVHIDPSLTGDCTGLVIAHRSNWTEVVRRDAAGEEFTEVAPVFETDLILRIIPPPGDEILLSDVRAIVYMFQEHGFTIARLTTDQYQSADTLQQAKQRGIAAEVVSVDRTTEPYEVLKTAFYEGRMRIHNHLHMIQELRDLQRVPKPGGKVKVDHPPESSKDVADGLSGVIYNLTKFKPGMPLVPQVGMHAGDEAQKVDHSWVTGGSVMVPSSGGRGRAAATVKQPPTGGPGGRMPFTRG